MDINELRRKRAKAIHEARSILERAESEGRDLNSDEERQWNAYMDEANRLAKQIERAEAIRDMERNYQGGSNPDDGSTQTGQHGETRTDNPFDHFKTQEYRNAYETYIRRGKNHLSFAEERVLQVGQNDLGGYTVPDEMERNLVEDLREQNVMRQLANVIQTSGERKIPIVSEIGKAYWTGENQAYQESDTKFEQKTLDAHKATALMRISEELLNDSAFDLDAYIRREFAYRIGDLEEEAMITGDGNGKPRGVVVDAEVGVTAAGTNDIDADELLDLFFSVRRPFRRNATWLMHDQTVKVISKIKDANGQYLWQPGLQAGVPDRIKGRPVAVSDFMPEIGAGNRSIAFGDFNYYWIGDRVGRSIQRLNELYAENGQIGFRGYQRSDGILVLNHAIKVLEHPSS